MDVDIKQMAATGLLTKSERLVRVSLPGKVANDLKAFTKVQAAILDRLGCQACCSGWDIRWEITRNFGIDEKLNIRDMVSGGVIIDG